MPCLNKNDILPGNRRSWTIVRKLGEGQFAEVYEGRDVDDYTRKVGGGGAGWPGAAPLDTHTHTPYMQFAIKIEKNVRILKVEQRALAALQHVPAMCKLHEHGVLGEKMFLVLEVHAFDMMVAYPHYLLVSFITCCILTWYSHTMLSSNPRSQNSCWDAILQSTDAWHVQSRGGALAYPMSKCLVLPCCVCSRVCITQGGSTGM